MGSGELGKRGIEACAVRVRGRPSQLIQTDFGRYYFKILAGLATQSLRLMLVADLLKHRDSLFQDLACFYGVLSIGIVEWPTYRSAVKPDCALRPI